MKKRKIKILALLAALIGGASFFAFSEAAPEEGFEQVSNGMTKEQVMELLGEPHFGHLDDPTSMVVAYGGFQHFKWCTMEVSFGADGRVKSKFHDH